MSQIKSHEIAGTITESSSESVIVAWCRSDSTEINSSPTPFHLTTCSNTKPRDKPDKDAAQSQCHLDYRRPVHRRSKGQSFSKIPGGAGSSNGKSNSFYRDHSIKHQEYRSASYNCSKSVTFAPKTYDRHVYEPHQQCHPVPSGKKSPKKSNTVVEQLEATRFPVKERISDDRPDHQRKLRSDEKLPHLRKRSSAKRSVSFLPHKPSSLAIHETGSSYLRFKLERSKKQRHGQRTSLDRMAAGASDVPIRRAKSALPCKRRVRQTHYQNQSMPNVLQGLFRKSNVSLDTDNVLQQTVAHSQMKYWHLRKIIRDVLIRYGDIQKHECSQDIDNAISSYAIHLMFKGDISHTKLASAASIQKQQDANLDKEIRAIKMDEFNDEMDSYKVSSENIWIPQQFDEKRTESEDHKASRATIERLPNAEAKTKKALEEWSLKTDEENENNPSGPFGDEKLPQRVNNVDAIPLTSSKSLGGRLVNRILSVFSSRPDNNCQVFDESSNKSKTQTSRSLLQDQIYQLVDKSSHLMTETQENLTNLGNMIDSIQSVMNTNTKKETIAMIDADQDSINVVQGDNLKADKYEYQRNGKQRIPSIRVSQSTSSASMRAPPPDDLPPYGRLYPIINPGGDAVIIHNSNTMEEEEVVLPQVDTSLDAGKMWDEATELMKISAPDIDVSLDADSMWQEILTNVGHTNQTNQQDSTKWWTCPTTPLNDNTSLEEANWSFQLLPRSPTSISTSKPNDVKNMLSSPLSSSSSERFISVIQADTKSCMSLVEGNQLHCEETRRQHEHLTQHGKFTDDTLKNLSNVVTNMEKMLSELLIMVDNLTSNTTKAQENTTSSSDYTSHEDSSYSEESLQSSSASSTSIKMWQLIKPSKCDELMARLNQGLQKMFMHTKNKCKPSEDIAASSLHQDSAAGHSSRISADDTDASCSYETEQSDPCSYETEQSDPSFEGAYVV